MKKVLSILFLFLTQCIHINLVGSAKPSWAPSGGVWSTIMNDAFYKSLSVSAQQVVNNIHSNVGLTAAQAVTLIGTATSVNNTGTGQNIKNATYYGGATSDTNWFLTTQWLGQCATLLSTGAPPYQNMNSFNIGNLSQVDQSYITNHLVPALQALNSAASAHVDTGAYTSSLSFTPGAFNGVIIRTIYNNTKTSFEIFQGGNQIGSLKPGENKVALYGAAHGQGDIVFVPETRGLGTVRVTFKKGPDVVTIANTTLPTSQQYSTEYPPAGVGADSEFICVQITKADFPQGSSSQMESMIQRTQCINTSELTSPAYLSLTLDDEITVINQGAIINIDQSKIPMFYMSMYDIQVLTNQSFPFLLLPNSLKSENTLVGWFDFLNIVLGATASNFGTFYTPEFIHEYLERERTYFIIKEDGNDFGSLEPSKRLFEMDPNYGQMMYAALNRGAVTPSITVEQDGLAHIQFKGPKTNYMDIPSGFNRLNTAIKNLSSGKKIKFTITPGTGSNVTLSATNADGTGVFSITLALGNDPGDYAVQYMLSGSSQWSSLSFKDSFTLSTMSGNNPGQPIQTVTSGLPGTEYLFTADIPSLETLKFYLQLHKSQVLSGERVIGVEFSGPISIGAMLASMKNQPKLGQNIWQQLIQSNRLGAMLVSFSNGTLLFNIIGNSKSFAKAIVAEMSGNPLYAQALSTGTVSLPMSLDTTKRPNLRNTGTFKGSDLVANLQAQSSGAKDKKYFPLGVDVWTAFLTNYQWRLRPKVLQSGKTAYIVDNVGSVVDELHHSNLLLKALLSQKQVMITPQGQKPINVNSIDLLQAAVNTMNAAINEQGVLVPAVPYGNVDIDMSDELVELWFSPVFEDGTFAELALQSVSSVNMQKIQSVLAAGGSISFDFAVKPSTAKGCDGIVTATQYIFDTTTSKFTTQELFTYTFSSIVNNKNVAVPSNTTVKSLNITYQTNSMSKPKVLGGVSQTDFSISSHRLYIFPAPVVSKPKKTVAKKTAKKKQVVSSKQKHVTTKQAVNH